MARKKKEQEVLLQEDAQGAPSGLSGDVKRSIVAIILFVIAFVSFLGFFDAAALVGQWADTMFRVLFGVGKWIAPVLLVVVGIVLLQRRERTVFYVTNIISFTLAFVSILALIHLVSDPHNARAYALAGHGGGYIGYMLAALLKTYTGTLAGAVILLGTLASSLLIGLNMSLHPFARKMMAPASAMTARMRSLATRAPQEPNLSDQDEEDDDVPWDDTVDTESVVDAENDHEEEIGHNIKSMSFAGEMSVSEEADDTSEAALAMADDHEGTVPSSVPLTQSIKKRRPGSWRVPPLTLVEAGGGSAHGGDTQANQNIIQSTFAHFGIALDPAGVIVGPTVTQYAFRPQAGVKLSRITALSNDLALALAAHPIRIEAPIPGKSLVGIEVPNQAVAPVRMQDALRASQFPYRTPGLMLTLGKDVAGQQVIADLGRMPHVLVAGSTGSGKSVTINAMILSLLYQNTPDDVRLILVDPKRVELSLYNGIPHLLTDVIVENGKVLSALKWAVGEMERRYATLQSAGARDLASFNQKYADGELDPQEFAKLPSIVIVIDEMADLMASHGKEVEGAIVRLAQMARAVGIHLIVSTQRPSVEVITGLIKANIPTRIALRVATQIDSRTILDMPGAEKLVGRGDMLYLSSDSPQPKRIQSIYVSEQEVKRVVDFLRQQEWPDDDDAFATIVASAQTSGAARMMDFAVDDGHDDGDDPLYNEAKNMVIQSQRASTSYLQRRFRIGYSRAARLMDLLEQNGVIAPADGAKPRAVLLRPDGERGVDPSAVPLVGDEEETV